MNCTQDRVEPSAPSRRYWGVVQNTPTPLGASRSMVSTSDQGRLVEPSSSAEGRLKGVANIAMPLVGSVRAHCVYLTTRSQGSRCLSLTSPSMVVGRGAGNAAPPSSPAGAATPGTWTASDSSGRVVAPSARTATTTSATTAALADERCSDPTPRVPTQQAHTCRSLSCEVSVGPTCGVELLIARKRHIHDVVAVAASRALQGRHLATCLASPTPIASPARPISAATKGTESAEASVIPPLPALGGLGTPLPGGAGARFSNSCR